MMASRPALIAWIASSLPTAYAVTCTTYMEHYRINPQIYIGVMGGANQLEKAAACSTACGFAKISLRRGSYGCYCPQVSSYGYLVG